ncbi:MAG: RNA methyltransferase, partial [Christiangramia sp.]|nr:RNA methyltransferase [Christiangramia sp.]
MLSKSQIKLIKSLAQKKFRNKHELFIVEGLKGVEEFIDSDFELVSLFTTGETFDISDDRLNFVEKSELKKITSLKTPQEVLAVFKIPRQNIIKTEG